MVCPCCQFTCATCGEDCDWPYKWPAFLLDIGEVGIECGGLGMREPYVYQDIFHATSRPPGWTLPVNISWKPGYPEELNGCDWAFVQDRCEVSCCYQNCEINGQPADFAIGGREIQTYRVMVLVCPDGPESAQILDITNRAIDGPLTQVFDYPPVGCAGEPVACDAYMDFFPTPEFVCNEFP